MHAPLFVYGTFRPEGRMHSVIEAAVIEQQPAELHGAQMWVPYGYWFPVLTFTDNPFDVVYGDLMYVRPGHELMSLMKLEAAAGFDVDPVFVWTANGPTKAITFRYLHTPNGALPVPSGNWFDHQTIAEHIAEI